MNDQQQDQDQHQKKYQTNGLTDALTEQVQQGLDEAADGLDMALQSRLRRMRVQAVEAVEHPSVTCRIRQRMNEWFFTNPVMQGAAFASVTTLALSLWLMPAYQSGGEGMMTLPMAVNTHSTQSDTVRRDVSTEMNEMDVLMSNEDMDFLENLEVYEWLEAEYG